LNGTEIKLVGSAHPTIDLHSSKIRYIFQKTHNLSALLELCLEFDESFESLHDAAETLTPYEIEFRYPREIIEPEKNDVEKALGMTETA
jgi:hypothetical protein